MDRPKSQCAEVEEVLVGLLQDRGGAADLDPYLDHIGDCPDCGTLLALAQRPGTRAGVPDPGPGYWQEFLPRLESRIRDDAGRRFGRPRPGAAVLAIAACLVAAFGWMVLRSREPGDDERRLEARFERVLLAAPEQRETAATALEEILPDGSDPADWNPGDSGDSIAGLDAEWFLAAAEIEDVRDLVGDSGSDPVVDLDAEDGGELLRQLQEELEKLKTGIPEARRQSGSRFTEEETT